MNVSVLEAIEIVINTRIKNGISKESLNSYTRHLLNDTWKNCPNICDGIKEIAKKYDIVI